MVKNPLDSDEMKFLEECQKENENGIYSLIYNTQINIYL